MSKIEKIVGRLLLTDQINSEEAITILSNSHNEKFEENNHYYNNSVNTIESDYNLEEMSMDECLEKLGFIPDQVLRRHGLEQLIDEGHETGCNIPGCSCKNEKYSLPTVGAFSVTNITEIPYPENGYGNVISMMKHQSYCKSKGALASEDCICCHYTYNFDNKSDRKTLLD